MGCGVGRETLWVWIGLGDMLLTGELIDMMPNYRWQGIRKEGRKRSTVFAW